MDSDEGPSSPKRSRNTLDDKENYSDEDLSASTGSGTDEDLDPRDAESSSEEDCKDPLFFEPLVDITFKPPQPSDLPSTSGATAEWTATGEMKNIPFTNVNSFHGPRETNPVDYFNFFFEEDFLQMICDQTNVQAERIFVSKTPKHTYKIPCWKNLEVAELKIFLGLLFHMGTLPLVRLQDYWKKDRLFSIPIFREQMGRNRFFTIMKYLHFTTETSSTDPLYQVRDVINYFNNKMKDCYHADKQLTLDENMVLWRGLLFGQNTKLKQYKNGVKLYMLTEPDGLVLQFRVSIGSKHTNICDRPDENVVMDLLQDHLGKGYEIYMDSCYNSVTMAKNLLDKKTYCTGILRPNLQNNPRYVINKNLQKGENISRFYEGVHVGKWKDKRDQNVIYITTQYSNEMVPVINKHGTLNEKPEAIANYNELMSEERQVQLLSFYPCARKAERWCLKVAIHTFQLLFINSYIIYNRYPGQQKMTLYDFRLSVINELLPEKRSDDDKKNGKTTDAGTSRPISPTTHRIKRITDRCSTGRIRRKQCRQCYKQNKKRTDSTWNCIDCDDKPGLCVECFAAYHAEL